MTTIYVTANDQQLILTGDTTVAAGDVNTLQLSAVFSEEWDGFSKKAVFYHSSRPDDVYGAMMTDDVCVVPWEVLEGKGILNISILGRGENGAVKTTTVVGTVLKEGARPTTKEDRDPTPDVYQQIMAAYGSTEAALQLERGRIDQLLEDVEDLEERLDQFGAPEEEEPGAGEPEEVKPAFDFIRLIKTDDTATPSSNSFDPLAGAVSVDLQTEDSMFEFAEQSVTYGGKTVTARGVRIAKLWGEGQTARVRVRASIRMENKDDAVTTSHSYLVKTNSSGQTTVGVTSLQLASGTFVSHNLDTDVLVSPGDFLSIRTYKHLASRSVEVAGTNNGTHLAVECHI